MNPNDAMLNTALRDSRRSRFWVRLAALAIRSSKNA